jgi:two-component system, NtrC family, sensor histidine kinase PilS
MLAHRAEIIEEIERRRHSLNLSLLRVYNYFRLVMGLGLLVVFLLSILRSPLGSLAPDLFLSVTLGYCAVNLTSVFVLPLVPRRYFHAERIAAVLVAVDIVVLTALMYGSGGVGSGIGLLLLVCVAAGAILGTGRIPLLLAALATIAVLYQELYISLSAPSLHDDYFQAGLLGGLFFGAAVAFAYLSRRVRENDLRALAREVEMVDLERINRQIIARMRTGIAVVDAENRVRMANRSARALLGCQADEALVELPRVLAQHLDAWRNHPERRAAPLQVAPDTPEIRVNFSAVRADQPHADVTVFIEDTAELQQQAQQLKLAALGRLSASIAHEIRNPLGAISHAAQLLCESEQLGPGDRRLTEIIHNHGQRMNRVVENVLETSRRRPPTPVRLQLAEQLTRFAEVFRDAVPDAEIEIAVEPADAEVRMDKSQLEQVLTNLVGNAIRHSREHSGRAFARLEGGVDPRTDRPYLNIIDHGCGVAEKDVAHLFDPFFTTAPTGTGLGLYISRELCEANQARLTYYRHPADGACFRIAFSHPDRIIA